MTAAPRNHQNSLTLMRFLRNCGLVLLLAFTGACSLLNRGSAAAAPGDWEENRAEILALLRSSSDAWNRGDLPGHLDIYVDSATFMTEDGPRPGVERTRQAFERAYWRDGRPLQRLDFEQVTIRPLGTETALQTGRFILSGGGRAEQSGWFSLIWIRTDEGWRAVHDHSS